MTIPADLTSTQAGGTLSPGLLAIKREIKTYRRELPRLLAEGHEGRCALIKGDEVISIWDTFEDAYQAGRERFGFEAFIAQPVDARYLYFKHPKELDPSEPDMSSMSLQGEAAMDEPEREYLRQQIQDLERARRRWKTVAIALLVGFSLFLVVGTGTLVTHGLFTQRLRMEEVEQARRLEMRARLDAEMAAAQARLAEAQLEEAAQKRAQGSEPAKKPPAPTDRKPEP